MVTNSKPPRSIFFYFNSQFQHHDPTDQQQGVHAAAVPGPLNTPRYSGCRLTSVFNAAPDSLVAKLYRKWNLRKCISNFAKLRHYGNATDYLKQKQ